MSVSVSGLKCLQVAALVYLCDKCVFCCFVRAHHTMGKIRLLTSKISKVAMQALQSTICSVQYELYNAYMTHSIAKNCV